MDYEKKQPHRFKKQPKSSNKSPERLFESTFQEIQAKNTSNMDEKGGYLGAKNEPFSASENSDAISESEAAKISLKKIRANSSPKKSREKSSLRKDYEAEVAKVAEKNGSLEEIRQSLGLSQRKMCQLLLVDPSAWTRWVRPEGKAPPHIWRALQWYLILQKKHPELKSSVWLNTVHRPEISKHEMDNLKRYLSQSMSEEQKEQVLQTPQEPQKDPHIYEQQQQMALELVRKEKSLQTLRKMVIALGVGQVVLLILLLL